MKPKKAVLSTRDRILEAVMALMKKADGPVSMAAIAEAASLSRQTLYLVFDNKADLFVALVRRVDEIRGVTAELAKIEQAPTGVAALERVVAMQAKLAPPHRTLYEALDLMRRRDPDAERAWQDRMSDRNNLCRSVVTRLANEGALRPELSLQEAADLFGGLVSFRLWQELVAERHWTAQKYRDAITELLLKAIVREKSWPRTTTARK